VSFGYKTVLSDDLCTPQEWNSFFAWLVPDNEKVCLGSDLAEILAKAELPDGEARAWHHDLQAARKTLKAVADKWR